jgi:DMSO/TMAO reductase YedYZ molybdopterin-dependent catalytic subunit
LVAKNGTSITLYSNDLALMESYTANGGTRSSSGSLANFGSYTGVPIMHLLELVDISNGDSVKITASDGYSSTYSYSLLSGEGVATYDATGATKTPAQSLTMIVAYYLNGTVLPSNVGPLRTMYIGSEGLYSSGNLNAKMVVKIEIV